jgi:hypothetical protein
LQDDPADRSKGARVRVIMQRPGNSRVNQPREEQRWLKCPHAPGVDETNPLRTQGASGVETRVQIQQTRIACRAPIALPRGCSSRPTGQSRARRSEQDATIRELTGKFLPQCCQNSLGAEGRFLGNREHRNVVLHDASN